MITAIASIVLTITLYDEGAYVEAPMPEICLQYEEIGDTVFLCDGELLQELDDETVRILGTAEAKYDD